MKLIGQEEVWENLKQGKAVQRAWAWFQGALAGLMGFVHVDSGPDRRDAAVAHLRRHHHRGRRVPRRSAAPSSTWRCEFDQLGAQAGAQPAGDPRLGGGAGRDAVHRQGQSRLRRPSSRIRWASSATWYAPGKLGFQMFAANILEHLKTALINWLVGPLAEAGVYIPKSFSLLEIVKLVLSVLGLTWQNIRTKLLKIIPEPVLVALEKTASILVTLVTQGPAAAWEQIKAELTELKDQLIGQVTQMVPSEVVKAAVTKLVMMLNPAGAVDPGDHGDLEHGVVLHREDRADRRGGGVLHRLDLGHRVRPGRERGQEGRADHGQHPGVVISFLAKFAGLGGIPDKLVGIVKKIRAPDRQGPGQDRRLARQDAREARGQGQGGSQEAARVVAQEGADQGRRRQATHPAPSRGKRSAKLVVLSSPTGPGFSS